MRLVVINMEIEIRTEIKLETGSKIKETLSSKLYAQTFFVNKNKKEGTKN